MNTAHFVGCSSVLENTALHELLGVSSKTHRRGLDQCKSSTKSGKQYVSMKIRSTSTI